MNKYISKNTFRCHLIIFLNLIFTAFIATIFSFFIMGNVFAIFSGILISIAWNIMIYIFSSKIVFKVNNCTKIIGDKYFKAEKLLEKISTNFNITPPQLCLIEDSNINSISIGKRINHSKICLTTGAISNLNEKELNYLLTFELLKISKGYTKYFTLSVCSINFMNILSDLFFRSLIAAIKKRGKESESFMRLVLTTIFLTFGPFFNRIAFEAKHDNFENNIDNECLNYIKDPVTIINTIIKINNINKLNVLYSRSCSNMFAFDTLIDQQIAPNFSYHVTLKDRIENMKKRVQIN